MALPSYRTAHAPFGTCGGGGGYLKWEAVNNRYDIIELEMSSGQVDLGIFHRGEPPKKAEFRMGDLPDWRLLLLPQPMMCNGSGNGDTLMRMSTFFEIDDCFVFINLPAGIIKILRRVDDNVPDSSELSDGYWYQTVMAGETRIV